MRERWRYVFLALSLHYSIEVYGGLSSNHQDKTVTQMGAFNSDCNLAGFKRKCLESWIKSGMIVSGGTHRIVCRESKISID